MLITTTESTSGQKKLPENEIFCIKFKPYIETNGVSGYRRMRAYLAHKGVDLFARMVHKYANLELGTGAMLHCATKSSEISRRHAA